MFKLWRKRAEFLWRLLDDIDTASDIAKGDMHLYQSLVEKAHRRRFDVADSNGYRLFWGRKMKKAWDNAPEDEW